MIMAFLECVLFPSGSDVLLSVPTHTFLVGVYHCVCVCVCVCVQVRKTFEIVQEMLEKRSTPTDVLSSEDEDDDTNEGAGVDGVGMATDATTSLSS